MIENAHVNAHCPRQSARAQPNSSRIKHAGQFSRRKWTGSLTRSTRGRSARRAGGSSRSRGKRCARCGLRAQKLASWRHSRYATSRLSCGSRRPVATTPHTSGGPLKPTRSRKQGQGLPVAPSQGRRLRVCAQASAADGGIELLGQPERRWRAKADIDVQHLEAREPRHQ